MNDTATPEDASPDRPFVITRLYDAPREAVWRAWTEADALAQWWGPKGCTVEVLRLDVRPGGVFHYRMGLPERGLPDGRPAWGKFAFREVEAPSRLVYLNSFADAAGETVRAPFSDEWPREMLSTVGFEDQDGKTLLAIHWVPLGASEAERRTFDAGRASMRQGWSGTLDQLAVYLAD